MATFKSTFKNTIGRAGIGLLKLAAPGNNNIPKSQAEKIVIDIIQKQRSMFRKEMDELIEARTARQHPETPRTAPLQDIYLDVMQDAHLTAAIENNRILPVKNKAFVIKDANEEVDAEKSKQLKKLWFKNMVHYALESQFYGYNLIHIKEAGGGQIGEVETIPRQHIIPERQIILKEEGDDDGVDYTKFPEWLLYAQLGINSIGLLEKAAALTILKRHSWANWDEFEQIFGIPIRIAKTASNSPKVQQEISGWLEEMGTAAYGIFNKGTEIEIKENNSKDAFNVFYKKIEIVNQELSKLTLGQTGTTDEKAFAGSAGVHQDILKEILKADTDNLLLWINDVLAPVLRTHGFTMADTDTIDVDDSVSYTPKDRIEIDDKIMQHSGYKLTKDYLEKTYSVELENPSTNSGDDDPETNTGDSKKKS